MKIYSPAFQDGGRIPARFTCDGDDVSPALEIEDVPPGTRSLALIMDDPDAPSGRFVHWVAFNIPVQPRIEEDSRPGVQGINDFRKPGYGGCCPPAGSHRYFLHVFALDRTVELPEGATRQQLEKAMEGHILDQAQVMGTYSR